MNENRPTTLKEVLKAGGLEPKTGKIQYFAREPDIQQSALNRIEEIKPLTSDDRFITTEVPLKAFTPDTYKSTRCKYCTFDRHDCLCATKAEERIAELKKFMGLK